MQTFKKLIKKFGCVFTLISFITFQLLPPVLVPLAETLPNDSNSDSTMITLSEATVKTNTTTDLSQTLGIIYFGDTITFIAKVSNYNATGTVTFMEGTTVLGTAEITGGSAYFKYDALSAGNHSITAVYSGDSAFNGNTSNSLSVKVNSGFGQIALTSSLKSDESVNMTTFDYGDLIAIKCTLLPKVATGTITFKEGDTILGRVPLSYSNGSLTATLLHGNLSIGTHNIQAEYSGDSNMHIAVSKTLTITINKATPNFTLTSNKNPVLYGTNATLTANLNNVRATGTVTFKEGESVITSVPITVTGGIATLNYDLLEIGDHVITAVYSGDSNCNPSTSNSLPVTIIKGSPSVILSNSIKYDDNSNIIPFVFGDNIDFISKLIPTSATGTATFKDGATILYTTDYVKSKRFRSAYYSTSSLGAGEHFITVEYSGDTNYNPSTSEVVLLTITKADTITSITSSTNSCCTGDVVTYTANIDKTLATGTVSFMDGDKLLGTSDVASGVATFNTNTLSAGDHSITAVYNGDSNFNGSTSNASSITVTCTTVDTTTTLQSSNTTTSYTDSITFTATVNQALATGTITFKDGDTELSTVPVTDGSAVYTTSTLSTGSHNILVVYNGDSKYNPSNSSTITQTVNKKNTNTVVTSSLNPCVYGGETTFTITVNEITATGTITLLDGSSTLASDVPLSNIDGILTATYKTNNLSVGNHNISANYSGDSNFNGSNSNSLSQTITKKPSIISYINVIGPSSILIPPSNISNIAYKADVLDQYNNIISNESVIWSLTTTLSGVNISPDGVVTTNSTTKAGICIITAKSKTNSAIVGYKLVSLTKTKIPVQSVLLNKILLSMKSGSNNSLSSIIFPLNAYCESITWASSNPKIVTVNNNGSLHAIGTGVATITVNVTSNGKIISAKCVVIVTK